MIPWIGMTLVREIFGPERRPRRSKGKGIVYLARYSWGMPRKSGSPGRGEQAGPWISCCCMPCLVRADCGVARAFDEFTSLRGTGKRGIFFFTARDSEEKTR
jgi:hypothetical protein